VQPLKEQERVLEGTSYDPGRIPVMDVLHTWLDDEISCCQLEMPAKALVVLKPVKVNKKLMISVPVLAYFTQVCINNGFYPQQREAKVLQHVVDTYCSKETDHMSPKNFYNHFNQPTDSAARALRKILRTMLAEIELFLSDRQVKVKADKDKT
jgi:hypothetical protein